MPSPPSRRPDGKQKKKIGGMDMTIFEQAKALATAREAAEYYGVKVERNGMALQESLCLSSLAVF